MSAQVLLVQASIAKLTARGECGLFRCHPLGNKAFREKSDMSLKLFLARV